MADNVYLRGTIWTEKEDDFLCLHYIQLPQREIAKRLARTKGEVQSRLKILGLKLTEEQKAWKKEAAAIKMNEYRVIFWTDEKNELFIKQYPDKFNDSLAKLFNTSVGAIITHAHELGVKKSDEFLRILRKEIIPKNRYSSRTKFRKKEVQNGSRN